MLLTAILSTALLAVSVNAAAIAPRQAKTFKFQVDDPTKGKFFLAANGAGTQDETKALACELGADTVLKCAGKGMPRFAGDMTKLSGTSTGSTGWSIDATTDAITWSAQPNVKFSIGIGSANDVYAETCPHHWTTHGTAKAVYITPVAAPATPA